MKQIKSVLQGDKIAYELNGDWNWDRKGNAPLSLYLCQYETYGDGLTKHSNSWCAQWSDLTDACISLTQAIIADPLCDDWRLVARMFQETDRKLLAFALSIKYQEDKAQWFNFGERKVSSSEARKHDRRWEQINSWMDGSPGAALSILLNSMGGLDWLQKLCVAVDLHEYCDYCPNWGEHYFKPASELVGDWHQAFNGCRAAARAVVGLDYAGRAVNNALENSQREKQTDQVAA